MADNLRKSLPVADQKVIRARNLNASRIIRVYFGLAWYSAPKEHEMLVWGVQLAWIHQELEVGQVSFIFARDRQKQEDLLALLSLNDGPVFTQGVVVELRNHVQKLHSRAEVNFDDPVLSTPYEHQVPRQLNP
jgi:hypothetical protein